MRTSAVICFALAALFTISAVVNVSKALNENGGSSYNTGYIVGACLPPVILLVAGLSLAKKPK
jgi:hypothetical protein